MGGGHREQAEEPDLSGGHGADRRQRGVKRIALAVVKRVPLNAVEAASRGRAASAHARGGEEDVDQLDERERHEQPAQPVNEEIPPQDRGRARGRTSHVSQSHYVRVHMAELRKKIAADPARPSLVLTERGVGYRLSDRSAAPIT